MKTVTSSTFIPLLLLFLIVLQGHAWDDDFCDRSRIDPNPKYSYSGEAPLHWDRLSDDNKLCAKGRRQSPINVVPKFIPGNDVLQPVLRPNISALRFGIASHNYGFSCDETFRQCGKLYYDNVQYKLIQMHSHSPSEHRLNGNKYPLELHFVHKSASGKLAVFGTLFKFGKYNTELQHVIDAAQKRHYAVLDIGKLSGMTTSNACKYGGSLTTPPCTEGVSWFVSLNVMQASLRQIGQYREQLGESSNSRPGQNLNGRQVTCYSIN